MAIRTAMLDFPVVLFHMLCWLSPSILLLQSFSMCFFFIYLGQQKRFCSANNNPQGLVTAEEKLVFNLYLPFRGKGVGSCFSKGTASSISLLLTPAASKGGKGSNSLTAPAMVSNKATVCCSVGGESNTPTYMFNIQAGYLYTSCRYVCSHYLATASFFFKLIGGCSVFTVEHTVSAEVLQQFR